MPVIVPAVLTGSSVLIIVLSIPMILGKVPRNNLYGFRTPRTMSSDAVWYPANRFCGWALAVAGLVSLGALVAVHAVLGTAPVYAPVYTAALVVPLFAAVVASFIYLSRLR